MFWCKVGGEGKFCGFRFWDCCMWECCDTCVVFMCGDSCKCECCVVFRDSCLCLDQYVSAMGFFFMVVMGCYNRVTGLRFSLFQ